MKDSEIRARVLKHFYDHRRGEMMSPKSSDFSPPIPQDDIYAICDQLEQHGLIAWDAFRSMGRTLRGLGKISASGVDAVETDGRQASIELFFPVNQHFTFNSPSNVQVGDYNSQSIAQTFSGLIEKIEASSASPEEKEEAKSRLRAFLEYPLVTSVIGAAVGSLLGMMR